MMKNKIILFFAVVIFPVFNITCAKDYMVNTKWLTSHKNDAELVIIDMSDASQYQRFHIPGAIHLPYQVINQTTRKHVSVSVGPETIIRFLGLLGISRNSHVIIYDDMGGLNAARLFWELQRLKHEKVSLLNGGLVKWILDGNKVDNKPVKPTPVKYRTTIKADNNQLATLDDLQGKVTLLDIRSQEEYTGHPRQKRSGHVPGARWWSWDSSIDFNNAFQYKSVDSLMDSLKQAGVTSKKQPLIVYCRTGHRAAHGYFTLRNLGFSNVKLYDASMSEYLRTDKPLNTGMKP